MSGMRTDRESFEKAAAILSADPVLNTDMLQAIVRNNAEISYAEGGTVLLYNISCGAFMFNAASAEEAEAALSDHETMSVCVAHGDVARDALSARYGFECDDPCRICIYTGAGPLTVDPRFRVRRLTSDDAPFVKEHYPHGERYIDERIAAGVMFGAEFASDSEGKLLGFIGMHDDGSTGMLAVAPEYRRMGVASALQSFMFNWHRERGWIPYGQVYLGNDASFALQHSMGLEISKDCIRWMFSRSNRYEE